ncbi:MAG TPA: PhoU domain-containing protein [Candidatus Binatia bacterium]|nr:PhoU domain-containing protein [Candidatus Binatia bacterium]
MVRKSVAPRAATENPASLAIVETAVRETAEQPLKAAKKGAGSPDQLSQTALKAFLIARDAAYNVRDMITHSSRMAFLAIKECEQELDVIERYVDERTPAAITRVNETRARQLLTGLKSTTNLERIGDLMMSVALRVQARPSKVPAADAKQLVEMSSLVREMLDLVYRGFVNLDLECARKVLQMDKDVDRICHGMFQKHLTEHLSDGPSGFDVLLMAQALERAGDHCTNLAEDLYSLIEGRSLRHAPKKRAAT